MRSFLLGAALAAMTFATAHAAEKPATAAEIHKYAVGHDISCNGATLHYGQDGRYSYNGRYPGRYRISAGKICVDFDDGVKRCDSIVVDGGVYSLINSAGQRFSFSQ